MADRLVHDFGRDEFRKLRGVNLDTSPFSADLNTFKRLAQNAGIDPATDRRNHELLNDFASRRKASKVQKLRKVSGMSAASGLGGDVYAAIPRFYDPTEYWEFSQLPYDVQRDDHRFRLYKWLDLFYRTHYLIPILVDIFTRFPLVGMELHCKDSALEEFYTDIFFDRLDYEAFLVDLGREYWTFGQSFPLGSFNESLGVWEREELIDPTLVSVENYPILGTSQFHIKPPPELISILKHKEPKEQFFMLVNQFPELVPYIQREMPIPVSDVLLKQVAFKVSPRDTHGTPILLRALRTLMHEEKLLASQDAIAERLYSPLILAKLGVQDLGDGQGPWIPGQDELGAFRDDLDIALSSDFRLLVHHFGVEIQNVFGREQMPRLGDDFDRIERRLMQVFGVNPSLLSGGSNSQPYASSALQAEFLNQILRTFQGYLRRHMESRMLIVAEAQEHYDYEKRGSDRIPIMEEVVEYDEEGNAHIVEKNKLLIPELRMKVLDLRDEATQRNFLQQLRSEGVPIPDQDLAMGMNFEFQEALEKMQEELIKKTVAQQEAKVKTYNILLAKGLPIPPDLKAEVEGANMAPAGPGMPGMPPMGGGPGGGTGESILMPPPPMGGPGMPPPAMPIIGPAGGNAPDISHERTPLTPTGRPGPLTSPQNPSNGGGPSRPGIGLSSENENTEPILKRLPRKKADDGNIVPKVKPLEEQEESDEEELGQPS